MQCRSQEAVLVIHDNDMELSDDNERDIDDDDDDDGSAFHNAVAEHLRFSCEEYY